MAGGRGSLSFELHVVHGVICTTVDPRPAKLTKDQLRFLKQRSGTLGTSSTIDPGIDFMHSQHDSVPGDPWQEPSTAGEAGNAEGAKGLPNHIQAAFDAELWAGPHAKRLRAASLIVGLHPDQVPSFYTIVSEVYSPPREPFDGLS